MAHGDRGRRAGFSLVEMLTVIVILGLLAGIVTVSWRTLVPSSELHSSVRTLATTLHGARSEAIARNAEFWIEYDLEHYRYRVVTPFRPGGGPAYRDEDRMALGWTQLPESIEIARLVIDGVEYKTGIARVRFDALGAASGHTLTLLQHPFESFFTIDVQALTGLIDYYEGQFQREPATEADFS